jgi:hypothetical protein
MFRIDQFYVYIVATLGAIASPIEFSVVLGVTGERGNQPKWSREYYVVS